MYIIVIPMRKREFQLYPLLNELKKCIKPKTQIIIVEQDDDKPYNKALSNNVGVRWADDNYIIWKYVIFHDVDNLPYEGVRYEYEHEYEYQAVCNRRMYLTPHPLPPDDIIKEYVSNPFDESLVHPSMVKGDPISADWEYTTYPVQLLTKELFHDMNGWGNSFWGWGFEDSDFKNRALRGCDRDMFGTDVHNEEERKKIFISNDIGYHPNSAFGLKWMKLNSSDTTFANRIKDNELFSSNKKQDYYNCWKKVVTTPDGLRECNYNITNVTSADNTHHIKFTTEFTPRIFNKGIFSKKT